MGQGNQLLHGRAFQGSVLLASPSRNTLRWGLCDRQGKGGRGGPGRNSESSHRLLALWLLKERFPFKGCEVAGCRLSSLFERDRHVRPHRFHLVPQDASACSHAGLFSQARAALDTHQRALTAGSSSPPFISLPRGTSCVPLKWVLRRRVLSGGQLLGCQSFQGRAGLKRCQALGWQNYSPQSLLSTSGVSPTGS